MIDTKQRRVERIKDHSDDYDETCRTEEFIDWIIKLIDLNVEHLEALFELQMQFFSGSDRGRRSTFDDGRGYGRRGRDVATNILETTSINQLLEETRYLQLELCDLMMLRERYRVDRVTTQLNSVGQQLRRHHHLNSPEVGE